MKTDKIKSTDAILLVIDFQEKLVPVIKDIDNILETTSKLIRGCHVLEIPVIYSQQYTKGLGETVPKIMSALTEGKGYQASLVEKTTFSCYGTEEFANLLRNSKRKTVIVCGIETHICVQQTVLDLLEAGYSVYLINDAVGSRNNSDKKYAQRRMAENGAIGTTCEAVLFEILKDAKHPGFKEISNIIK